MSVFRTPKTQNERTADQAILHDPDSNMYDVKMRIRSGMGAGNLPTERDDRQVSDRTNRNRSKRTYSAQRKAARTRRDTY